MLSSGGLVSAISLDRSPSVLFCWVAVVEEDPKSVDILTALLVACQIYTQFTAGVFVTSCLPFLLCLFAASSPRKVRDSRQLPTKSSSPESPFFVTFRLAPLQHPYTQSNRVVISVLRLPTSNSTTIKLHLQIFSVHFLLFFTPRQRIAFEAHKQRLSSPIVSVLVTTACFGRKSPDTFLFERKAETRRHRSTFCGLSFLSQFFSDISTSSPFVLSPSRLWSLGY